MIRRLARLAGRAAIGVAVLALLAAGFLHTPPGRNLSRQLLLGLLRRGGLDARLTGATLGLARLEASILGLELARPGQAPFLVVEAGRVRFSGSILRGRPALRELEVSGLRLFLVRSADGRWNLPESTAPDQVEPVDLRPFLEARIAVRGATVHVKDASAGFEAEAKQVRFDWSGDDGRGDLAAGEDARWRRLGEEAAPTRGAGPDEREASAWSGHVALEPASLVREGASVRIEGPALSAPEGRLAFAGAIEDLEGTPRLRAQAEGHAEVGRLAGPPWRGGLTLRASASGPLFGPEVEIRARGEGLAVADLPLQVTAAARTDGGALRVEAEGRLADGRITASATFFPSSGDARAEAKWDGLDVARLLQPLSAVAGKAVRGRMAGSLVAGWPADTGDLARLTVEGHSTITADQAPGATPLAWRGRTTFRLQEGRYVVDLDHAYADAASIAGRVEGRLAQGGVTGATLSGPLRIVVERPGDLARAAGASLEWPLTGRLESTLALGGTLRTPEAAGPVQVRDFTARGGPPIGADARILLKEGRAIVEGALARGPGLEATGAFSLGPGDRIAGEATARVTSLADWRGAFPPTFAPAGRVEARATLSGTTSRPEAVLDIEGHDVSLLGQPVLRKLAGRLRAGASDLEISSLLLERAEGRLEVTGTWSPEKQEWSLRATAHDFALSPGEGTTTSGAGLPLTARLNGQIFALRAGGKLDASGTLAIRDIAWRDQPLGAGTLEISSTGDTLDVDLRLADLGASAFARLDPNPPFALRGELRLVDTSLDTLAKAFGAHDSGASGTATLSATWEGEATRPDQGRVEGELVRFDGVAHGLRFRIPHPARFFAARDRVGFQGLELESDGLRAGLTGALSETGEEMLELRVVGDLAGLDPVLRTSDDEPLSSKGGVELVARIQGTPARPRPEATLTVADGSVSRGEKVLLQNVALEAGLRDGTLRLGRLDAETTGLRLSVTGEAGAGLLTASDDAALAWPGFLREALRGERRGNLQLRAETLQAQPTSADPAEDASPDEREARQVGPLLIEASLETEAASLRSVRGRAEVRGLGFSIQGVPLRQDQPFTIEIENGRLTLPEVSWKGGETDLRLGGNILLADHVAHLNESALDLRASGVVDLRALNALARGLEAGGLARLETDVTGTFAHPKFLGGLRLEDAVLTYRPWRLRLDDLTAAIAAKPGQIAVESLSGTLNGGTLAGRGVLELVDGRPRRGGVEVMVAGANVDWPSGFRGSLDGTLALRGTDAGPVLAGDLTLANASYRGDPQTLATTPRASLGGKEEGPAALAGLGLDLRLRTEADVRVDNPFGVFAFSLDVTARGTAAAPRLLGQVALEPRGFVFWSGRKFTIERGTLDWKGASGLMPFVQARATARVSNYEVFADFSGPLASADARLVSNPPLGSNEITSLLVTGSTSAGVADARALGIVSANFLGNLGRGAGLDSVRIDQGDDQSLLNLDPTRVVGETNPAQRLTITKRLSANLEATVSLNLSESGKTTTFVAWKPRSSLEVRVSQRDDYTGTLELRHDVALGGGSVAPASPASSRGPSNTREVVAAVEVDDRAGGDASLLRSKLRLRPGKRFTYDDWQRDRNRIEATVAGRGFAEAYVLARREPRNPSPGGGEVTLTYVVHRGPRTNLQVRGLDLPPDLLRDLRQAWSLGDYKTSIESEALLRIRTHLAQEGHFTPTLTARIETSQGGDQGGEAKTLVIEGDRGPRARDRRIVFEGVQGLPLARLQALVKGKDLLAQAWNEPSRLEAAVAAEYTQAGFLAAEARAAPAAALGDEAVMRVATFEGPSFTRGPLRVEGCVAVACTEVEAAFGLRPGGVYLPADNAAARSRVLHLYRRGGWNAAQVRLDGKVRAVTASVDVTLAVDEGPQQILREVVVEGGASGTKRALAPLVRLEPGSPVVLQDWAAARKRVYETGLVRGVSLEPEVAPAAATNRGTGTAKGPGPAGDPQGAEGPLPSTEPVTARLTYDQWPALRLRYGLQLITDEPLASGGNQAVNLGATAELTRSTLLGRALSTGLSGEVRQDIWSVRGVLSAPRSFGKALRSSLYLVREREEFDVNLELGAKPASGLGDSWEFTLEERFRPAPRIEVALSYDIQWVKLGIPSQRSLPRLSFRPARLIPTVLMDARNNILDPSRGFFSSITYNYGAEFLGSEFAFNRFFTQQFLYRPLPGRIVAASALRYERAAGVQGQAFLSTERLGFGGPTTIRGYDRDEAELLELLSAFGATTQVLLLNQEVRFPLLGDLRGVAFFDYGELRARIEDSQETRVRMGTGLGLRYSTAVGVLRFDVGFPLRGEEKKTQFYFGLGQAF